jgi:hypothetical protein
MVATLDKRRPFLSFLWFGTLTILSLMPLRAKNWLQTTGRWHQQMHVSAFLIAGLLIFNDNRRDFPRAAGLVVFCGAIEWLQTLFYGHPFEWRDLFNDCMGIILALLLTIQRRKSSTRPFISRKERTT